MAAQAAGTAAATTTADIAATTADTAAIAATTGPAPSGAGSASASASAPSATTAATTAATTRGYYAPYYAPYYDGYYDPALVVAPSYSTAEPGAPRVGQPVPQAAAPAEPIFYPRNGQSAEATESDRRECNRWATTQRGAMDDASIFQRATFACMEGRGYTVR